MKNITFGEDPYACAVGAIVTERDAFRAVDLMRIKDVMTAPVIVDLRNIYRPQDMKRRGFTYTSIGR